MNTTMNTRNERSNIRRRLLAGVSAAALAMAAGGMQARADEDRPILWVEFSGQMEQTGEGQEAFSPPFEAMQSVNPFTPASVVERTPRFDLGEGGRISFAPEGSDWVISAAVLIGRSNGSARRVHEETHPASATAILSVPAFHLYNKTMVPPNARRFSDVAARDNESHRIIDFQAGKDVGLGMFGGGSSTLSAGVRFAEFNSKSTATINGDPDFAFHIKYATQIFGLHGKFNIPLQTWDLYAAKEQAQRSFRGLGPSISWDASLPLMGSADSEEVTFDFGVNGAALFGKQKVRLHHDTNAHHKSAHFKYTPLPLVYSHSYNRTRSRSVVIPNIGGFAGLSLKFPNAKISLGYRADLFIGAMDGGIDVRKEYDRNFYGPFASISFGLGD